MTRGDFEARLLEVRNTRSAAHDQVRELADLLWPVVEAAQKVKRLGELRGSHYIDVVVRINGKDVRHEGDWLKDLSRALAALAPSRGGES